jgi:hypothetical protein
VIYIIVCIGVIVFLSGFVTGLLWCEVTTRFEDRGISRSEVRRREE